MTAHLGGECGRLFWFLQGLSSIPWPHLPRDDFLVDLDRLVSEEGWVTSSHLVDEDSESPPVHSLVVALEQDGGPFDEARR